MTPMFEIEQVVLGSLIEAPDTIGKTLERVPPEEFSGPHQLIAETLAAMDSLGLSITPVTVMERLRRSGLLVRVGGAAMIHTLVAQMRYPAEAEELVDVLESESIRRRARAVASRLLQRLDNPTVEVGEALAASTEEIARVGHTTGRVETLGWPEGDDDPQPEWVIPHLLAYDERIMVTGGEGLGKTMLIRQLVASVAVGYHPFLAASFPPGPALHVDLENPRHLSDSAYRRIRNGLRQDGIVPPRGTLHRLEPRIFDVSNPQDVAWMLRAVRQIEPRLIAIGPVKNMHAEDPNEEQAAVRIQAFLNRLKGESNAALVLEGHAGHASRGQDGDWRPRGSSAWLGWPEFGYGLRPVKGLMYRAAELVPWRGSRSEGRLWPERVAEGTTWPWVEAPPT